MLHDLAEASPDYAAAWATLFCWGDYQAGNGNAYWEPRWGLFSECGGRRVNAVAPLTQDGCVENVMREINGYVDTFCLAGQGCTWPWDMDQADDYLNIRTGTTLRTDYNPLSLCENALRNQGRHGGAVGCGGAPL